MFSTVYLSCPNCAKQLETVISVPEPDFSADKMRDSGVYFSEVMECKHCNAEIELSGANGYYGLSLEVEGLEDEEFYFSEPDYEFEEYDLDSGLTISGIIKKRAITSLFHFSKVENLSGIIRRGIVPRARLKVGEFVSTDDHRWDGFENASCLSISFPQYSMFYRKRCDNPTQDWAVLEIDISTLEKKICAFFETNAASNEVKKEIVTNRKTATAFERMFDDSKDGFNRLKWGLPENFPTDPQAEVLVFGNIEPTLIKSIHFETEETRTKYKHLVLGKESAVSPYLFEKR